MKTPIILTSRFSCLTSLALVTGDIHAKVITLTGTRVKYKKRSNLEVRLTNLIRAKFTSKKRSMEFPLGTTVAYCT